MQGHYDVVVVGGGPSGSTAAYYIDNLNVLIIDKFYFPRSKACGGVLNHLDDLNLFENYKKIETKLQMYPSNSICLYWDRKPVFNREYKQLFKHVDRHHFDYQLLKVTLSKSNVSFKKFNLKEIIQKKEFFILSDGTNHIKAKYLIGADGWDSTVSRFLGNKRRGNLDYGICLEHDLTCEKKTLTNHVFYFYKKEMGYAWLFPTKAGYYIGLGFVGKTKKSLKAYLAEFVQECIKNGLIPEKFNIRKTFGAPEPMKIAKKYATNKIMLCGDALGTVKQVTGEGIYHAMMSGKIAGQIINLSTENVEKRYKKAINPLLKQVTFVKKIPPKIITIFIFYILTKLLITRLLPKRIKERYQNWFVEKFLDITS